MNIQQYDMQSTRVCSEFASHLKGSTFVLTNFPPRSLGVPTWLNFLRLQMAVAITMTEP